MKRLALLVTGIVALLLGIVGIVIPLLPTTPFLLLASACFMRSSDKMNSWLMRHRVFGNYILAYQKFGAVSGRAKAVSLFFLWVFILYSILFIVSLLWIRIILLLIAIVVSMHLIKLKTLTSEMKETIERKNYAAKNPDF